MHTIAAEHKDIDSNRTSPHDYAECFDQIHVDGSRIRSAADQRLRPSSSPGRIQIQPEPPALLSRRYIDRGIRYRSRTALRFPPGLQLYGSEADHRHDFDLDGSDAETNHRVFRTPRLHTRRGSGRGWVRIHIDAFVVPERRLRRPKYFRQQNPLPPKLPLDATRWGAFRNPAPPRNLRGKHTDVSASTAFGVVPELAAGGRRKHLQQQQHSDIAERVRCSRRDRDARPGRMHAAGRPSGRTGGRSQRWLNLPRCAMQRCRRPDTATGSANPCPDAMQQLNAIPSPSKRHPLLPGVSP
jgi:hypothetical protein